MRQFILAAIAAYAHAQTYEDMPEGSTTGDEGRDDDYKSRPLCYLGGEWDKPDNQLPSPGCCRVYEDVHYKGRYFDFCLGGGKDFTKSNGMRAAEYDFTGRGDGNWQADEEIGYETWGNEISSFKCANDVRPVFEDTDGPNGPEEVKAGPGASNPQLDDQDNIFDKIKIVEKHDRKFGTLYQRPECCGVFTMIQAQEEVSPGVWSSMDTYGQSHSWKWEAGKMKSVFLDADTDFEVFNADHFKANSITIKNYSPSNGKCFEIKQNFKNRADGKESLQLRTMTLPQ